LSRIGGSFLRWSLMGVVFVFSHSLRFLSPVEGVVCIESPPMWLKFFHYVCAGISSQIAVYDNRNGLVRQKNDPDRGKYFFGGSFCGLFTSLFRPRFLMTFLGGLLPNDNWCFEQKSRFNWSIHQNWHHYNLIQRGLYRTEKYLDHGSYPNK